MNKIIFIGPCGGNKIATNGASIKNLHLTECLRKRGFNLRIIDTEFWKTRPHILIKLLLYLVVFPHSKIILSLNNMSAYRLISILNVFFKKREVIYWVIGGTIAQWICEKKVKSTPYKFLRWILVEGKSMQSDFLECSIDNTLYVPNFKKINYIPIKTNHNMSVTRFVFLSRITSTKGCDYIFDAIDYLHQHCAFSFAVDFYGPIDEEYRACFNGKINQYSEATYKGFLDLKKAHNYDILSQYDVMLFPTFWAGEGFPGVLIDAFIAGLPIIASDWNLNSTIVENMSTGVLVLPHDLQSLVDAMILLSDRKKIKIMSENCQQEAIKFDIDNVINDELLTKIGLKS